MDMKTSPWGPIDHSTPDTEGWRVVKTASHGGLMASVMAAADILSQEAIAKAVVHDAYYCWEEDCLIWIPALELLTHRPSLAGVVLFGGNMTADARREYMQEAMVAISRWNPDYLLTKGIPPIPEPYRIWQDAQQYNELLARKDPDLIVGTENKTDSTITVICADGAKHEVVLEAYKKVMNKSNTRLLSDCTTTDH